MYGEVLRLQSGHMLSIALSLDVYFSRASFGEKGNYSYNLPKEEVALVYSSSRPIAFALWKNSHESGGTTWQRVMWGEAVRLAARLAARQAVILVHVTVSVSNPLLELIPHANYMTSLTTSTVFLLVYFSTVLSLHFVFQAGRAGMGSGAILL